MANVEQNNEPDVARSEQMVLNQSQDKDFNVLAVELLGVDDISNPTKLERVVVDADGNLNTTQQLSITQSIDETAYDLAASAYSQVITPDFDYIIDNFQLDFSTTESRTITLTSDNGTKIYEATNTNSSVAIGSINFGQESGDSFTLAITQTSGACTVDIALYIKNSPVALTADPVLAAGENIIGMTRDFYLEVARGNVTGYSTVSKFGQNDDLDASYQDVWDGGGTYTYPADGNADITEIVSTSSSDTEDIEVQGLDINGDLTVQTETLTGTTPVTLTTPLWRVFRLKNVGTSDLVGAVTAENTANTVDYAKIAIGNNQTLMALYTIPNGKTGYMIQGTNSLAGVSRAYAVAGRMAMRQYGKVFQLKKTFGLQSDGTSFFVMPHPLPGKIPAKTDIRVSAESSTSTGVINTTFEILLVDD